MDSSVNFRSRKRKQCSSSNPLNDTFTCSKSQIQVHRSRSGRACPDITAPKPSHQVQLLLGKPLKKPRNVHHPLPENGASLDLSIKDLRARARRVFSPVSVIEEKSGKFELGTGLGEEGCIGASNVLDDCENLDLRITDSDLRVKSSDSDSGLGFVGSGKAEDGDREDVGPVSEDVNPILGSGSHGQPDKEEDVNLNEKTPVIEKKNEGNEVESGKDCCENKRNSSISGSGSILNSCSKRKLFKAPSSFSYRRLLPFLMDMAKDDSSILKIDVADVGHPCKVQKLINVNSKLSSALKDCGGKHKHINDHSDHTKPLGEGNYQNSEILLPVKGQGLDDPTKKMAKTKGNVGLSDLEQRNQENGMNGVDKMIEEFVQTTPPADTIFSELDNDNAGESREINASRSGTHILEKPSNNFSNVVCISLKSHPGRKSNTISNAKLALNPCSRLKIFKTSSFSYRRLLPFLTDVAKSASNIDQHPKYQRGEGDSHPVSKESVDENVPANGTRTDDFPDRVEAADQEPLTGPVYPIKGSSEDISPNMSSPFFSSGDSLSNEKSNTSFSEASAKPDMLLLERRSQYEEVTTDSSWKLESELPTNGTKSCRSESNFSAETSCSTINHESLSRESKSEVSHVSEHDPIDIGKECMALGLDYQKDKLQLIKSVSLNQSSLEIEEFDNQGNQRDSPSKVILKRNPRGCRGLCNCLNCSSFRLHAERSFEFSKNQMLDAEEVAHGLIHELAELRNLFEKPAFDDSDLSAIQINQLQAKEACKRALKTEQLAKIRLSQMNDDLNIHCRITRPRVTFSRYIEEITIPKADLSTSPDRRKQDDNTK